MFGSGKYFYFTSRFFQTILNIQKLGYKPILAHPERYNYYHSNFDIYKQIKDAGCFLQLNLLSLSRYYGVDVTTPVITEKFSKVNIKTKLTGANLRIQTQIIDKEGKLVASESTSLQFVF